MSDIFSELAQAKETLDLINIYQLESDDFYTGTVVALDENGVVLATVNENGIKDGFVFIQLRAIAEVESDSPDLSSMAFRIKTVAQEHLLQPSFLHRHLNFDPYVPLLDQVLALAYQEKQLILLALADEDDYYEGVIQSLGDTLKFDYFNRFNYAKSKAITMDTITIDVVEFGGLDLYLGRQLYAQKPQHQNLIRIKTSELLPTFLEKARQDAILISMQPKDVTNNFFVGYVTRLLEDSVLLSLLDMTGQFGGYVLIRLSEIAEISAVSDYIHTIGFYEQANKKRGLLVQPVLKQPWPIHEALLWSNIIYYAQTKGHLIRIRYHGDAENSYLGYPSQFDGTQFELQLLDERTEQPAPSTVTIRLEDCLEIAFDYLNSYLLEAEFRHHNE
ncbi:hypothetical protein ACNAN0_12580 [Agrilactobacillus fermenti]|uniref:hypothetical protein n=1 Tax=Agrilactobacillus fermenti TaxID=2586909 RepID=UPI001E373602|nr:hypothetical protein [Agrilactobacillus fermenti]MCD2255863.1 hypothetical protein [Agrilactobacillus fermenti]